MALSNPLTKQTGSIYLIPTLLDDDAQASQLPAMLADLLNSIDHYIVEDLRSARRFMRKAGFVGDFDKISFYPMGKNVPEEEMSDYLSAAEKGFHMAIISEAGMPCIADPGAKIVQAAHQKDLLVEPIPGANSMMMALMSSGLNGQKFIFHGYLPRDSKDRIRKIVDMERRSLKGLESQLFMEAPYRNNALLKNILNECHPDTFLCIASGISGPRSLIKTKRIRQWRKEVPDLNKIPAIFVLSAV